MRACWPALENGGTAAEFAVAGEDVTAVPPRSGASAWCFQLPDGPSSARISPWAMSSETGLR